MRNPLVYLTTILLLICSCSQLDKFNSEFIVLRGATIFDGMGNRIENGIIVIDSSKIIAVGTDDSIIPESAEVKDVTGKFITPGLIDAHIHFFQTGFFDARPDALDLRDSLPYDEVYEYQKNHPERYYESYLRSGVTGVYDVGGFPWSISLQDSAENNPNAPHVAASGILITPVPRQYLTIFNTENDSVMVSLESAEIGRGVVLQNSQMGSTGIKIWQINPNDSAFLSHLEAVRDEIERQNNKMIVHATSLEQAKIAVAMGAKLLVHSVSSDSIDDEFIELLREHNTIYTPTIVVHEGYLHARNAVLKGEFHLSDPNGVVDDKTLNLLTNAGKYINLVDTAALRQTIENQVKSIERGRIIMNFNLKRIYDAGIPIAVGTDAGNPGTLHGISIYDELEAMQEAGIPPDQLIIMATRNGARTMDREEDFGTIEIGKLANLIILDEDPSYTIRNMRSITHVMRSGKLHKVDEKF